jgi:predicted enzyme related to lactoylglutathione lyase
LLGKNRVITTIAVHDLENASVFYGEILGLKIRSRHAAGVVFESGGGLIGIHESGAAGTGQATCAWWTVDDVEAMVVELKSRGIVFEKNLDLPHAKSKNGVYHLSDTSRAAWFNDPDGNVLGFGNF